MNSPKSWDIHAAGPATKSLKRIPAKDRERILAAITAMREDPFSGDVAYLQNDPRAACRRRVGAWRIFFDVLPERRLVIVQAIERRTSTTY